GISKTAIFSLVRRFHQVFTDWPLSGEYSCVQLARALFPGRYPSAPTVTQTVKTEKTRRNQFSPEFKWRLVQQTLLPGACVAQIARENGINDNLLFNWRRLWRNGGLQSPGEHETSLLPVTLTPEPDNKIPAPVQIPEQTNTLSDSLCCELVLPAGTLRLKGKLTPALLQTLIREIKGSSH
ncbi:IS66-like element accessory protein TnpA, partial [Escherichia coli]|nr:transposase [Escherichia coli]EHY4564828.1 transposase [Escherichia coli]